eukprot:11260466-Ditylum_brightwellii.AAC.1
MPAKPKTNIVDSDNPFDQYASDISSSSVKVSNCMYPARTTIDDLLGSTDIKTPCHKYYSQCDGYLCVGYEHRVEERIKMSITSALPMSTCKVLVSKESDNSYSSSVGGGGGGSGRVGGDGTGGGLESGTDGEASIASIPSALQKNFR